jgi:co-chaperonin GroES (HSP10)
MKVICPFDRLVVKREECEQKSEGGIFIPDKVRSKHPPHRGTVVYVGDKCEYAQVGDTTIFMDKESYYDGIPGEDGVIEEYVFLSEKEILAIQRGE